MQWSYLDLWRVTQHECFTTRFTYLKGSSMELFTLEPTSKINFGLQHNTLVKGFRGNITSLSSWGIQYRILAVHSAQGPLFIGWGLKWASGKIYLATVRTVDRAVRTDNCANRFSEISAEKSFLLKDIVQTGWHIVRMVARLLQVISL